MANASQPLLTLQDMLELIIAIDAIIDMYKEEWAKIPNVVICDSKAGGRDITKRHFEHNCATTGKLLVANKYYVNIMAY